MRKFIILTVLSCVALMSYSQTTEEGSPRRIIRNLGGAEIDSFLQIPLRVPKAWKYSQDSVASIGFDLTDHKLKLNNGAGVVSILTNEDTSLIKYYIDNNPKLSITWDSVKNKPGLIDTIAQEFAKYYTIDETDALLDAISASSVAITDTAFMLQWYRQSIQTLITGKVDTGLIISINGQEKSLAQNNFWNISKSDIGLGNTDNTSDAMKPVSIATQIALSEKEDVSNKSNDTLLGLSFSNFPTQYAAKKYIDRSLNQAKIAADNEFLSKSGGALSGPLELGGDPALPLQPVTLQYLNGILTKLSNKKPVDAVTDTNVNINAPGFTVLDGVPLVSNLSRILVKDQSNKAENGIYVWQGTSHTMVRDVDFNSWDEIAGAFVFSKYGTAYRGSGWVCIIPEMGTINMSDILFEEFTGKDDTLALSQRINGLSQTIIDSAAQVRSSIPPLTDTTFLSVRIDGAQTALQNLELNKVSYADTNNVIPTRSWVAEYAPTFATCVGADTTTTPENDVNCYIATQKGSYDEFVDQGGSLITVDSIDLSKGEVKLVRSNPNWRKVIIPIDPIALLRKDTFNSQLSKVLDLGTSDFYKTSYYPSDKSGTVYSDAQLMDNANFWGNNSIVLVKGASTLERLYVSTTRAGTIVIGFATISGTTATVIHTSTKVISGSGIHSYSLTDLGSPDLSAYDKVYVVIRNSTSGTRCANYKPGVTQSNHFWFPSAGGTVTQNNTNEISFWATINENNKFALPLKVEGVRTYEQLIAALATQQYIYLDTGTIVVTSNINLKHKQKIIGKGQGASTLKAGSGCTIILTADQNAQNCTISDLTLEGTAGTFDMNSTAILPDYTGAETNTGIGTRYGLYINRGEGAIVQNVEFKNFDADGMLVRNVGYASGNLFSKGINVNNIWFVNCYRGINIDGTAEYSRYSNVQSLRCLIGATLKGGNNKILNWDLLECRLNFHQSGTGAGNNAHGNITNLSANHATNMGAYFYGITNGQPITNMSVFFTGVVIDSCKGLSWTSGQVGANADVTINNSTGKNGIYQVYFSTTANDIIINGGTTPSLKGNEYIDGSDPSDLNN